MADETPKRTPPYISFMTFDNFVNGLADTTVPHKVDSSLLRNMSGSTRSGLMVALRYLGLTDEKDNTSPDLEKLAESKGDDRKALLKKLILSAYQFTATLNLARATPGQLADAIGAEGSMGGTRDKAVAFFLKAAEAAGIEISPHILKRKHAASPKRAKRVTKPGERSKPNNDKNANGTVITARSPYDVLMKDIYDPTQMQAGSDEEKAVFTLARFLRSKESAA